MEDIQNGFSALAEDLSLISNKVADKNTEKKALETGAKPVVERAKSIASRFRRTGRLVQSIGAQYSEKSNTMRIGIGEPISTTNSATGFYGRFQDRGWHVTRRGKSTNKGVAGAWTRKARIGRRTGRFIRNPFIDPAYEAEKERVYTNMINTYQKELD